MSHPRPFEIQVGMTEDQVMRCEHGKFWDAYLPVWDTGQNDWMKLGEDCAECDAEKPWAWTRLPGWPGGHWINHLRFRSGLTRSCTCYIDAPANDLPDRWLTSARREDRR